MECYIVSVANPDLVITARGGKGSPLVISRYNGGSEQLFKIKKKHIMLASNKLCVDISGGENKGNKLCTWDKHDGDNQKWTFHKDGTIRSPHDLCFDINGGNVSDGAEIIAWSVHGGANQQWRLVTKY